MLINPRLTDYHGIAASQADIEFAIPFFKEDIPLYIDPFLLWKSPSQQDQALHTALINGFNHLGYLSKKGKQEEAIRGLTLASECDEVGLGSSATRTGKRIGTKKAQEILALFERFPEYQSRGFRHFEEIQFFVDGISKDRVSDIACSFLKSFLIDFTITQCEALQIPLVDSEISEVYSYRDNEFRPEKVRLPTNPENNRPLILVPKRWLRFSPWLNYDDYFANHCPQDEISHTPQELTRVKVLNFNRDHYDLIDEYVREKERTFADCKNDPLFPQIPVLSAKRKLAQIRKLPTGKDDGADMAYETGVGELLPSLFYPKLDFAAMQSRTVSGAVIRDIIFYNNRSDPFMKEIFDDYGSRQMVFEMKNVREVSRDHVAQLNRYMTDDLGKFGVLVTRNPLTKARMKSTVDLWSGQRRCIITITDDDLSQMVELFESNQRLPIDVLKKKYVEYRRMCPS